MLLLPNFIVDHFVFKYFQRCDLIENLWLAELHQVVDYHIRDPQILKAKIDDWQKNYCMVKNLDKGEEGECKILANQ